MEASDMAMTMSLNYIIQSSRREAEAHTVLEWQTQKNPVARKVTEEQSEWFLKLPLQKLHFSFLLTRRAISTII